MFPRLAFATPRKLPKASSLEGRVVVLDIAFASTVAGSSFEKTTLPFIQGLGPRLIGWVDHHDHDMHAQYANDPRFVLAKKQEHGACPEMITPELVSRIGIADTICCHTDFDGLCSAAKWIRGGKEPYPGADKDAYAIDTRLGQPKAVAKVLDEALRARPNDDALSGIIVRYLADGLCDPALYRIIYSRASEFHEKENESKRLAQFYEVKGAVAVVDATVSASHFDKTALLLFGQKRATVAVVLDAKTVSIAADFESGINLLTLFGMAGGMPTRISLPISQKEHVLKVLYEAFPQ